MIWLNNTFNTREMALGFWGCVFIVWMSRNADVRRSLAQAIRATAKKPILLMLGALVAYVGATVWALWLLHFWTFSLLKDTIYWFLGVGLVAFVNVNDVERDERFFRKTVIDNFKVLALVEFVSNLFTFSFLLELVLTPLVLIAVACKAYVDARGSDPQISKALGRFISTYGVVILIFTAYHIGTDFPGFATLANVKAFLLPIMLTVTQLGFIYVLALGMKYETTFLRLTYFVPDESLRRYARRRLILRFHLDLYGLSRWSRRHAHRKADNKQEVQALIRD